MLWRKSYFLELFSLSYTANWSPGGRPCSHKAGADIAVSPIMQPEFSAAQKGSVLLMGLPVRVAYLMLSHILSNRVGNKSYLLPHFCPHKSPATKTLLNFVYLPYYGRGNWDTWPCDCGVAFCFCFVRLLVFCFVLLCFPKTCSTEGLNSSGVLFWFFWVKFNSQPWNPWVYIPCKI